MRPVRWLKLARFVRLTRSKSDGGSGRRKGSDLERIDRVSKLPYSATMSLDGFIAGPGGDM